MSGIGFGQLEARVVEVKTVVSGADGRRLHTLSGYLVADGLVLTCAHDVIAAESVSTRLATGDRELTAEVIWPLPSDGPIDSDVLDVALLHAEGLKAPIDQHPVWAEYSGFIGAVGAHGIGFPWASKDTERFHSTPVDGTFLPGEGKTRNAMVFSVTSTLPADATTWAGLSGAMIRDDHGRLLGIAAKLLPAWRDKFLLVPAPLILGQPRLRRLLGDPRPHTIASEDPLIKPAFEPLGEETDFKLITARYGQVPFVEASHGDVLDELADWCNEPQRPQGPPLLREAKRTGAPDVAVRILLGPGGSGKTRLAAELCRRLQDDRERHWLAGFAREDDTARWESFQARQSTLIVFDYVERPAIAAKVAALLTRLDELGSALMGPVRVLLVSRSTTNWYDQVDDYGRGVLSRRLRIEGDSAKVTLAQQPFDRELKRLHFKAAFERFAVGPIDGLAMDDAVDAAVDGAMDGVMDDHLGVVEHDHYDSPLLVHIAALLAARSGGVPSASPDRLRDALLDHLIRRERRQRWASVNGLTTSSVPLEENDQALHAIAITTLTEPTPTEAAEFLKCSPLWEDLYNVNRRDAVKAALRLYPGGQTEGGRPTRIAPIEPDLVAERLLVTVDDLGELIEGLLHQPLTAHHYARLLHILALTNDHYPKAAEHFEKVLGKLLVTAGADAEGDAENRAEGGESTAAVLGQTLPRLIEGAIRQVRDGHDPTMAKMLTGALRSMAGNEQVEQMAADTVFVQCEGHPELVLLRRTLYELASEHFRRSDPRGASLRGTLEGLIDALLELDEGSEAFEVLKKLEGARWFPDFLGARVYAVEHARFDKLLSLLLREGKVSEAFWAFTMVIRSWGVAQEGTVYRWGIDVFTEFDSEFWNSNRFAQVIAPLRNESLSQLTPWDGDSVDPELLVRVLEGIKDELLRSGRLLEALRVGTKVLKLRDFDVAQWLLLDHIADQVWESGSEAFSDEFMQEFSELRRRVAIARPGHAEEHVAALEKDGNRYAGRGMWSEASRCFWDATQIRRDLLDRSNPQSRFRLIAALDDYLAVTPVENNRIAFTIDVLVGQWEALAGLDPAYEIGHAIALEEQSLDRWAVDPGADAVSIMRKAERIRRYHAFLNLDDHRALELLYPREAQAFKRVGERRLAKRITWSFRHLQEMVDAYPGGEFLLALYLERQTAALAAEGKHAEARRSANAIIRLHRKMNDEMKRAYASHRADALMNLCGLEKQAENWIKAGSAAERAAKICRANTERGLEFKVRLAHALTEAANMHNAQSHGLLGLPVAREAVELLRELLDQSPRHRSSLAGALMVWARSATQSVVERGKAVAAAEEAVEIYRALAEEDPSKQTMFEDYLGRLSTIKDKVAGKTGLSAGRAAIDGTSPPAWLLRCRQDDAGPGAVAHPGSACGASRRAALRPVLERGRAGGLRRESAAAARPVPLDLRRQLPLHAPAASGMGRYRDLARLRPDPLSAPGVRPTSAVRTGTARQRRLRSPQSALPAVRRDLPARPCSARPGGPRPLRRRLRRHRPAPPTPDRGLPQAAPSRTAGGRGSLKPAPPSAHRMKLYTRVNVLKISIPVALRKRLRPKSRSRRCIVMAMTKYRTRAAEVTAPR